jgi:hypothetical protein
MHRQRSQQARPSAGLTARAGKRVVIHACEWTKPYASHKEMNLWFIP